ncbi:MAG: PASTA domain-containing protein [Candidatus Kryptoniota bacterium]
MSRILLSGLAIKFYVWILVLVGFFSLMNWVVMPWYVNDGGTVIVPDVSGMTADKAKEVLDTLGLQFELGGTQESKLPPNTVLTQNPEESTVVKHGRRVYLIVSGGVEKVNVPDLHGHTQREAQFMLERAGFRLGNVGSDTSGDFPPNVVVSQSIPPNTLVATGTAVSVVVSNGTPNADQISVPDFVGKPLAVVQKEILNSGLVLGKISFQSSTKLVPNTVLEQYPRAGEIVPKGNRVDLFVSSTMSQHTGPEN